MKNFDEWNNVKKETNARDSDKNFSEREVWFMHMGINVGFEQDGKGEEFLRPVLIFKKFSKQVFLGIPLTKTKKKTHFYHTFGFKGEKSTAILSQVRLFDARRLKFRFGKVSVHDYLETKTKLMELIR